MLSPVSLRPSARRPSHRHRGGRSGRDLRVVYVAAADRVLEFLESLAEGTAGVGQSFRSKKHERDDQDYDEVGGLQDAGEQGAVLSLGGAAAASESRGRPVWGWSSGWFGGVGGGGPLGEATAGGVGLSGQPHDGPEEPG
jgi:hypothetical protein